MIQPLIFQQASRCWALPARHGSFESFGCCDWCECRRRLGDWLWLWFQNVSSIFCCHPYLGKSHILTTIVQLVYKPPTSYEFSHSFFSAWLFSTFRDDRNAIFHDMNSSLLKRPAAGDHGQRHGANSIRNPRAVAASEPLGPPGSRWWTGRECLGEDEVLERRKKIQTAIKGKVFCFFGNDIDGCMQDCRWDVFFFFVIFIFFCGGRVFILILKF